MLSTQERCLDSCAGKLIRTNHRLMGTYVDLMPKMVQRRMEEMETKAAENAKAAEAAAAASNGLPAPEDATAIQSPVTSSAPGEQIPTPLPSAVGEVELDASVKLAGVNIPLGLDAAISKSTTATDVTLSAATAVTPAAEAVNIIVHNKVESEPSYVAALPQLSITGAQIESGSFQSGIIHPKPVSLVEDISVSVVSAPTISQQERAPEAPGHQGLIQIATANKLKPDE